jgi:hypothetical protein
VNLLLRTRKPYVKEPALLLNLGVATGGRKRQGAFINSHQKYVIPFKALRSMQRCKYNARKSRRIVLFGTVF